MSSKHKELTAQEEWTLVIRPKSGWFDINFRELWQYRDLVRLFVKRNYSAMYKQTILGPLWFILSPLLTVLIFTIVFGNIAKIPTDNLPQFLFYMAGNTLWTYFAYCLNSTASTFTSNAVLFGKVYFPRLTMPLSTVIFGLISFFIQFVMFIGFVLYYTATSTSVKPNLYILITPLLVLMVALLGLGFGIIFSSLTTKYRDLTILISFGVQLWMYASPVVYPISGLSEEYKAIVMLNPMSPIIEAFRYAFLGAGSLSLPYLIYSGFVTLFVLGLGIIIFSRVEKTFIDTV
jgi:lipopolysaccharide transport system permease protein